MYTQNLMDGSVCTPLGLPMNVTRIVSTHILNAIKTCL